MRYSPAQQIVRKIVLLKKKGFEETSEKIVALNAELVKLRNVYFSTKKEIQKYPVKHFKWNNTSNKILDITEIFKLIKSNETYYGHYYKGRNSINDTRNKYTPCGLFYGTNSTRKLNGLLLFQIGGKPLINSISQAIKSDKFTFAIYYEFEEKVTNVLVKTNCIISSDITILQKMAYEYLSNKYKNLKITIPHIRIALPLTYDSDLYCNENSTVFK